MKMKQWMGCLWLCGMLTTACFPKMEQGKDGLTGSHPDSELLQPEQERTVPVLEQETGGDTAEIDTVDHLHTSMVRYAVTRESSGTDSVYHYPIGRKIDVGMHFGKKLYLELGEFYDDLTYNGADIYWGDSLIYSTGMEVVNDWHTCQVYNVDHTDVTYVLLLLDDRPNPSFWHIVCMNGTNVHLADHVLAGNDYVEGSRYFHDNVICEDIDGDGIIEVGGKYWTEYWADSMTYQPCRIYKLDRELRFDEALSERETRKAYQGLFLGFKEGLHIYNPNEALHEKREEQDGEL